jgi:hypothetical protein
LESWQETNNKRFLSMNIHQDRGDFCCIALTNPTEVIITSRDGGQCTSVTGGMLWVRASNY